MKGARPCASPLRQFFNLFFALAFRDCLNSVSKLWIWNSMLFLRFLPSILVSFVFFERTVPWTVQWRVQCTVLFWSGLKSLELAARHVKDALHVRCANVDRTTKIHSPILINIGPAPTQFRKNNEKQIPASYSTTK